MKKKHILCFGDSNTWGYDAVNGGRYDDDIRWTMQLQGILGTNYLVVEEGLSGRTTVFDDPLNEGLSGLSALTSTLMSHCPLDLMVLMLGTNDCKERFSANATNIKDGMLRLVKKARQIECWAGAPNILVVAPIIIDQRIYTSPLNGPGMGMGCAEKSEKLPGLYAQAAKDFGFSFMDSNPHVKAADKDFMHFDQDSNARFAQALAEKIKEILG